MPSDSFADDLAFARRLAVLATEIALDYFARGVTADRKADGTPVTAADVHIERAIANELARERPGDAILGEELGAQGSAPRRWILDPIDGTAYFLRREPDWGTHIALEVDGHVVAGVITRPVTARSYFASRGGGAFRGDLSATASGTRLHASSQADLAESRVTAWTDDTDPLVSRLRRAARWVAPAVDNVLRVAEGELEAVVDRLGKAWDHAPAVILVEEAGGAFSDGSGGKRLDLGEGRFTNGLIASPLDALLAS